MVIFRDQIFKNSLPQKAGPSTCFKKRSRVFQTFVRWAFEALKENQKFDWEFEKFGQVFKKLVRGIKKLDHVFAFYTAYGVFVSQGKKD